MKRLDGRVAVVTGGASGIGYALAERLLAEGDAARLRLNRAVDASLRFQSVTFAS